MRGRQQNQQLYQCWDRQRAQNRFLCSAHRGGVITGRIKAKSYLIKKWQESIKRRRETVNSDLSGSCYDNRNEIQH